MRARLIISILVVLGISYLMVWGWGRAVKGAREYVQEAVTYASEERWVETARSTHTFDLAGATRLTIENEFGGAEVRAAGEGRQAKVERIVFAGGTDAAARARAARFSLSGRRGEAGEYRIVVRGERRRPRVHVKLLARVPPDLALRLRLAAGGASVAGLHGPVSISVQSGGISVGNIGGPLTAETGSGGVSVNGVRARLWVKTGSGGIELRDIRGSATAETGSGGITLREVHGRDIIAKTGSGHTELSKVDADNIRVEVGSGGLEISLAQPFSGDLRAKTGSGGMSLALPASSNCRIAATTGSGGVSCSLPVADAATSQGSVTGRLGAGRGYVQMHTDSGGIALSAAPAE